jgi:2-dehydrotetronate isomerase
MPRFAANLTLMFTEWAFPDRFQAAADAGFRAVEFMFPYEHAPEALAARAAHAGVTIALFNCPPGDFARGERGLAALPARRGELKASLQTALRYATVLGVPRLHLMAGIAPRGDPQHAECYEASLREACECFAAAAVSVVIEPINGRDMPGYFLNDFNWAAMLIERLRLPNLQLLYDIYHRQILHGDVTASLTRLLPLIGHVQTAAVPGRNEPNSGELDDAKVFAQLDTLGYAGFVGCEYRPKGGTLEGLGWIRGLGQGAGSAS